MDEKLYKKLTEVCAELATAIHERETAVTYSAASMEILFLMKRLCHYTGLYIREHKK